jgi:hypothetical protein
VRYIVEYNDTVEARLKSAEIATEKGCGRGPGDITRFWFLVIEHPTNRRAALEVDDDYPAPNGRQKKTPAEMKSAGWSVNA